MKIVIGSETHEITKLSPIVNTDKYFLAQWYDRDNLGRIQGKCSWPVKRVSRGVYQAIDESIGLLINKKFGDIFVDGYFPDEPITLDAYKKFLERV
jgi:hypothetical protein